MTPGMHTACRGFEFKPTSEITKADFIRIVNRIGDVFGDGWVFEPEPISEGGIVIKNWPGRTTEMYKSMRFHYSIEGQHWSWPTIFLEDPCEEWRGSIDVVWPALSPRVRKDWCTTFLKAFNFAPAWTVAEITTIAGVLAEFGIMIRRIPRKLV